VAAKEKQMECKILILVEKDPKVQMGFNHFCQVLIFIIKVFSKSSFQSLFQFLLSNHAG